MYESYKSVKLTLREKTHEQIWFGFYHTCQDLFDYDQIVRPVLAVFRGEFYVKVWFKDCLCSIKSDNHSVIWLQQSSAHN